MKKKIYSVLFAIFGMLFALLVFGVLEIIAMYLLGPTFSSLVHFVFAFIFLAGGAIWGFLTAPKCWELLYEGEDPLYKVPIYKRRSPSP